jgi:hypothetical protein
MISSPRRLRSGVIIFFALEKTRSHSANIAGIARWSRASWKKKWEDGTQKVRKISVGPPLAASLPLECDYYQLRCQNEPNYDYLTNSIVGMSTDCCEHWPHLQIETAQQYWDHLERGFLPPPTAPTSRLKNVCVAFLSACSKPKFCGWQMRRFIWQAASK